jgi:hypothetical protein
MMLLGALTGAALLPPFGVRGALGAAVLVDLGLVAYLRLRRGSDVLESELSEPRV